MKYLFKGLTPVTVTNTEGVKVVMKNGNIYDLPEPQTPQVRMLCNHGVLEVVAEKEPASNGEGSKTPAEVTPLSDEEKAALQQQLAEKQEAYNAIKAKAKASRTEEEQATFEVLSDEIKSIKKQLGE